MKTAEREILLTGVTGFIGKEALKRIKAEGVKRKLVGIEIDGGRLDLNMTHWPVSQNGSRLGQVTSAVYSPRLKKNIGYAWVPIQYAELGTKLSVRVPDGGERQATVVRKPFVDPEKEIPKA